MYYVRVNYIETAGDEVRKVEENDICITKKDAAKFIARVVGEPRGRIEREIAARGVTLIKRDSQGWRAKVWYI